VRANPLEVVERPRVPEPNIKPADAAEVAALGAALDERAAEATDDTERAVIGTLRRMTTMAMSTGMRRGELLGLRWERVDLLTGTVRVEEGYSNHEFGDVKTSYSRRTLRLGGAARAALEATYAASAFTADDDLVFCHPGTGRPLDLARLNERYMRPALRKAGLADTFRPWHDQRHTALTFSAAVNLPYVVKNQAGHASSTTTDRYVRLAGVHLEGAADRTEALLFGAAEG
jgi:integrase